MPAGQAIVRVQDRGREGGEAKVYSCGHGTAVETALTYDKTGVTLPGAALEKSCGFFQIFDLAYSGWLRNHLLFFLRLSYFLH